jgi:hypothetical protein
METKIAKISNNLMNYLEGKLDIGLEKLEGNNLSEHWWNLGESISKDWEGQLEEYLYSDIPEPNKRRKWELKPYWTKYEDGKEPERVKTIEEKVITFDVEVAVRLGKYPTMAVARGKNSWYVWLSPVLFGGLHENLIELGELPKGEDKNASQRIIIGHNVVGYDRARIKEEYSLGNSGNYFLDTMSMHIAISGLSTKQRLLYLKSKKEIDDSGYREFDAEWLDKGSMNSLKDVVELHLGVTMNKTIRDIFVEGTIQEIQNKIQDLINYNVEDVYYTYQLAKKLWGLFKRKSPHPVTRSALLLMSKFYLPTTRKRWNDYISNCEREYMTGKNTTEKALRELAEEATKLTKEEIEKDQWLNKLNWELPSKRARNLKDKPEWYRALWDSKNKKIKITTKTQITPYLLRLEWYGYPLMYFRDLGWGYIAPTADEHEAQTKGYVLTDNFELIENNSFSTGETYLTAENTFSTRGKKWIFYKLPHKEGDEANCGSPLTKDYIKDMEEGRLTSKYPLAQEAIRTAVSCSYWVSTRKRILEQFLISPKVESSPELEINGDLLENPDGVIIPSLIPIGTVSRRATENTWLTASNPKEYKIGSELKATILAPKGFKIVGADVASQEAWIASLLADSYSQNLLPEKSTLRELREGTNEVYGEIGQTEFSIQCLAGKKEDKTDIHSFIADKFGISRDTAKVINYCVPLYAQALTKEGWKSHDELKTGEEIKGYNTLTGKMEWTKVKEIVIFPHAETYRIYNKEGGFNHVSTKEHRWLIYNGEIEEIIWTTTSNIIKTIKNTNKCNWSLVVSQSLSIRLKELKFEKDKTQIVWCVVTETGTWVMKQGDNITITGNSRFYGAGVRACGIYLKQFNKNLSELQTKQIAKELYETTKGRKEYLCDYRIKKWVGGTESELYNALEHLAGLKRPCTPTLNAEMSEALLGQYDRNNSYQTSRLNWLVQSTGVDFLHLMIVGMEYLIRKKKLTARIMITIHDEIRYLVKEEEVREFSKILNTVHLWVRAYISQRLNIKEIALSTVWFDVIDIDHTLRKEVNLKCLTPSKKEAEEEGYTLTPKDLNLPN